jgi:hypothetical protein
MVRLQSVISGGLSAFVLENARILKYGVELQEQQAVEL